MHEELDTQHKCLGTHKQSTPRAGEGLPAGAARLGRAALQNHLFELQDAVVDVEGVCHAAVMTNDGVRDALPVVLTERASAAGVHTLLTEQLRGTGRYPSTRRRGANADKIRLR